MEVVKCITGSMYISEFIITEAVVTLKMTSAGFTVGQAETSE